MSDEPKVKDLDSLAILNKIFADEYFSKNIEATGCPAKQFPLCFLIISHLSELPC